ncbi:MAG: phospholipid carrier-dependent glycosyltransferase [Xanthomonadales bacterium]|nr:phospholipid carrier-dependent glycosyltransferase [Xanthomonadales bacterium]
MSLPARPTQSADRRRQPAWLVPAVLVVLVLLAVLRSQLGTRLDSFTIDEPWHIVAGASYERTGDWRLNPEHPPLTKRWVGVWMPESLLALPPLEPLVDKTQERDYVERIVYLDNDALAIQQRARLAMFAFNGLLLLLTGLLAWRIFGAVPAVALVGLVALEPTLSAHMPLVMTDLPLALTLMLAACCAGLLASDWRWRSALLAGLAMGLALATKHSALAGLAALGLGLVLVLAWQSRRAGVRESIRRLGQLLVAALLAVAVLWAHYDFRFHTSPDGSDPFNREIGAKIGDLNRPVLRTLLATADDHRLLPRPYLWGLADTLRAGVEGRGQVAHLLWGRQYINETPWHVWPSQIVSKLPLATLLMLALALAVLLRARLGRGERVDRVSHGSAAAAAGLRTGASSAPAGQPDAVPVAPSSSSGAPPAPQRDPDGLAARPHDASGLALLMVLIMAGGHLAALAASQGAYAGIRHALPVVLALLLVIALALRQVIVELRAPGAAPLARFHAAAFAALLTTLLVATLPEPRLYEFHNRLAGGSENAWRNFSNESVDLGLRFHEIRAFHDQVVVDGELPFYGSRSRQTEGAGMRIRNLVESLDDDNVDGVYDGYFLIRMGALLPWPAYDWDPDTFYAETEEAFRAGNMQVRKGRIRDPRARANSIAGRLFDYIYRDNGDDWAMVIRRGTEVLAVDPRMVAGHIEIGNAHVRLGQREGALAAYRAFVDQTLVPADPDFVAQVRQQIARIEASETLDGIAPMRQPFLE